MKKRKKTLVLIIFLLLTVLFFSCFIQIFGNDIIDDIGEKEVITFTVVGTEYQTVEGTTFREFLQTESIKLPIGHTFSVSADGILQCWTNTYLFSNIDDGVRVHGDDIIVAQDYPVGVYYLTFEYMNTAYRYERGMTWADFIDSSYNIGLYVDNNNYIRMSSSGFYWIDSNGRKLLSSDKVRSLTYSLSKI